MRKALPDKGLSHLSRSLAALVHKLGQREWGQPGRVGVKQDVVGLYLCLRGLGKAASDP